MRAEVGASWTTPATTLGPDEVEGFAAATGDEHPLHTDPVHAATTRFGGPIVQGMLTLSAMVARLVPDPTEVEALLGLRQVRFLRRCDRAPASSAPWSSTRSARLEPGSGSPSSGAGSPRSVGRRRPR